MGRCQTCFNLEAYCICNGLSPAELTFGYDVEQHDGLAVANEPPPDVVHLSRQQRRAAERKARKRHRRSSD